MMRWKQNLRDKRGFTVMEAVFSVAILSMLGTVVAAMVIKGVDSWSSGISRTNAENAAETAAHKIAQEICVGAKATYGYGQLTVYMPTLVTDSYGESYYSSTAGTTPYRYFVLNGRMYRQINGGVSQLVQRDISSVSFDVDGDLVTYVITGTRTDGTSTNTQVCKGSIVMRNFGH